MGLALRLHMPVYRIRAEMPASELAGWMLLFQEEAKRHEPPSVEDVGAAQFARAMGAQVDG